MMANGLAMQLATLGVGMSSACQILKTNDENAYASTQEYFNDYIKNSADAIISKYDLALNKTI